MASVHINPANLSSIPSSLHFESLNQKKLKDFTEGGYFSWAGSGNLGFLLRNKFYLPAMELVNKFKFTDTISESDPLFFEKSTLVYLKTFTEMLKNQKEGVDPTFSNFEEIKNQFEIIDVPVTIKSEQRIVQVTLRFVQSHHFGQNQGGLRFILFSFNQNYEFLDNQLVPWNPRSLEEIATLPIDLIRALKQSCQLDTLVCFSLGALILEAIKDLKEDVLPSTIIINRGLPSIKKAVPAVLSPPWGQIVHYLASCYHLDADPENGFLQYLENNPLIAAQKNIVVIRATADHYFSGNNDYNPDFFPRIQKVVNKLFHGSFMVPYLDPKAHHAIRPDWIIAHPDTGSNTKDFLPIEPYETLADALANFFSKDGKDHTCLIIGGNKDTLDSILYGNAPILNSWVKKN